MKRILQIVVVALTCAFNTAAAVLALLLWATT